MVDKSRAPNGIKKALKYEERKFKMQESKIEIREEDYMNSILVVEAVGTE